MPWQTSSAGGKSDEHFKYQYHPGGDKSKAPKNAPSALHSVIVPNVTLPKVSTSFAEAVLFRGFLFLADLLPFQKLHDQYNKWGKEGYP